jgi:hypothetical protein
MSFDLNQKEIVKGFVALETVLNCVGYLPYVGIYAGACRRTFGFMQVVGGVGLAGAKALMALTSYENRQAKLEKSYEALEFAVHGAANYVRGEVEGLFFPLRLVTLAWDMAGLRWTYSSEKSRSGQKTMDMIAENVEWIKDNIQRAIN